MIVGLLTAFAVAGVSGFLGPKTSVVTTRGSGYTLAVTYPQVTRPGLPVRWEYTISHPGGFDGPVSLQTTFDYLHLFDLTNIEPEPIGASSTGGLILYRFSPPPGDVLRISMDAAAESGFHEPSETHTRVLVGGRAVLSVSFSTRVVP
jgi:hypothetical protein